MRPGLNALIGMANMEEAIYSYGLDYQPMPNSSTGRASALTDAWIGELADNLEIHGLKKPAHVFIFPTTDGKANKHEGFSIARVEWMAHGRKGPSKILKKSGKQSTLHETRQQTAREPEPQSGRQVTPHEMKLEPITDKPSYDRFLKTIALRIYHEFETSLRGEGVERPEISLVAFDMEKATSQTELRMGDYVALNARLIVEKAFVDMPGYAAMHMPRAVRQMEAQGGNLAMHVENKVQRDLVMEIRAIAMQHIPDAERYRYISKLKEF